MRSADWDGWRAGKATSRRGAALLAEGLALFAQLRDRRSVGRSLLALARIESGAGQGARAARYDRRGQRDQRIA